MGISTVILRRPLWSGRNISDKILDIEETLAEFGVFEAGEGGRVVL